MNLFNYKYLNSAHLKGLDDYKYNAVDTSPLSIYIMHPFWNRCVELFPTWFAPNLMTFLGFLLLVLNFILFSLYDFHFTEAASLPSWIWLVAAICQFCSHQLDGMDGKQARRTKSSSALGELFDHGVDSWASFLFPVCIFSIFTKYEHGFSPMDMHILLWTIYLSFICSHWEKYNTKVLFLPWSYDASMLMMTIAYLMAYFFKPAVVLFNIPIVNMSSVVVVKYIWAACALLSTYPLSVIHIRESYRTGTGYNRTFTEAIRPLISPFILFISSTWWAISSQNSIIQLQPRLFFSAVGTTFSNMTCRLVVAQMTATRSDAVNILVYLFALIQLLALLVKMQSESEVFLLAVYNVLACLAHLHYAICVVRQICDHLKIRAFKIKDISKSR